MLVEGRPVDPRIMRETTAAILTAAMGENSKEYRGGKRGRSSFSDAPYAESFLQNRRAAPPKGAEIVLPLAAAGDRGFRRGKFFGSGRCGNGCVWTGQRPDRSPSPGQRPGDSFGSPPRPLSHLREREGLKRRLSRFTPTRSPRRKNRDSPRGTRSARKTVFGFPAPTTSCWGYPGLAIYLLG